MKRFLFSVLSVMLLISIVLSVTSCTETEYDSEEAVSAAATAAVLTNEGDTKSDISEKNSSTSSKKSAVSKAPKTSSKPVEVDSYYQALIEKKLKKYNFNGVVRVSKKGKVLCEVANGKMSSDSDKDITTDTLFAIASCSKQFTAAAIMILKDDGKLSVSDTIDKYFPKYKYGKDITIKNLLTMRSGVPDFLNESSSFKKYDASKNASEKKNREVTLNWIFKHGLNYTPDGAYYYSNSNYFLLAEIVEKVSGMSFSDFLEERIFTPLGMNDTASNEELAYSDRLAVSDVDPWDLPGIKAKEQPLTIRVKGLNVGNGGLISTAADMDKWLSSLSGNKILSKESIKEMSKDYNPYADHYGYGVMVAKNGAIWHVGALDYYASYTYTIPKKEYNFFAVTNDTLSMTTDIYTFANDIIKSTK
ncbi:MAG: beta-lactamase family protein [Ruminococcus sp.]|nr:beta-lactamase family protein [Ruminococcus sp.]